MDLVSIKNIKNLLKEYNFSPRRGLGQNFLINRGVLRNIITAARLAPDDIVVEIGPGLGTLTRELAKMAKAVVVVEKDPGMTKILSQTLEGLKNIKILQGDALKIDPESFFPEPQDYKVVANLPYYIVAPLLRKFLEAETAKPLFMVLMVQKEVAQRICAKPPKMNLLAASVQFYAKAEIIFNVPNSSFWPKPKVDGAVIKITPRQSLPGDKEAFFKIAKAGFAHPRKQLINNLATGLKLKKGNVAAWLLKNNIAPIRRAETLGVEDLLALAKSCKI